MSVTNIEWTDRVWNPVTGCQKVSPGCKHCYAEGVAHRFWATQYPQIPVATAADLDATNTFHRPRRFTDVMTHADRLLEPLSWRKPQRIFVNSMSDLFHEDVPDQFIVDVFGIMALTHWHTFQVLTKRPERMRRFLTAGDHGIVRQFSQIQQSGGVGPKGMFHALSIKRRDGIGWQWPLPNVWLGVSVEDQRHADERIPLLLQTPAAVRFISAEPLLGPIALGHFEAGTCWRCHGTGNGCECAEGWDDRNPGLDWVIVGGESGPGARPCHEAWVRSIVQQCQAAGVPAFVKQLGAFPIWSLADGRPANGEGGTAAAARTAAGALNPKCADPSEWPDDLRVREFPR